MRKESQETGLAELTKLVRASKYGRHVRLTPEAAMAVRGAQSRFDGTSPSVDALASSLAEDVFGLNATNARRLTLALDSIGRTIVRELGEVPVTEAMTRDEMSDQARLVFDLRDLIAPHCRGLAGTHEEDPHEGRDAADP